MRDEVPRPRAECHRWQLALHGGSWMAWAVRIVEIAASLDWIEVLGCELKLDAELWCAARMPMATAWGATWRRLLNCGSVVEQELAS